MNYSQLKNTYQFLGEIYKLYDKLDQSVDEKHPNEDILNLCDKYDTFYYTFNTQRKSICKKLLRNLFLCNSFSNDEFRNCCSNIYVWLYFELKKSMITDHIIQKIFDLPKSKTIVGRKNNYCPFFSFNDKIHSPEKLMGLRIFNDNIHTIQSMLKGEINQKVCSLIRFIYKCILIYRDMNSRYCSNGEERKDENKNSCGIICQFNNFYTLNISSNSELAHKFPELTSGTPLNVIDVC
ncbi:hypothetical protein PVIIG_05609 [Plasmodium vivax India VII]|uniref:PIR Superfamily Protein n=1 Tax=Plasmodium vivax India VII TaxID=1077284 RepID=A0A0J9S1Y3_PLAVI|nr:hypothetical protein PVIIG_05609 [Plasmodium vivax India VII]